MKAGLRLNGVRFRNQSSARVEAILCVKESENSWRARIRPSESIEGGDRLRFGDASESPACFLAFLDADIVEKDSDSVLLSFHFTGAALDEALERLSETTP